MGGREMIALLFALLSSTMVLGYFRMQKIAYAVFAVTMVMSAYWLKFHATSQLTIQL
jgi:lipopolysaccharide export LptBFGC system permease protein LptF